MNSHRFWCIPFCKCTWKIQGYSHTWCSHDNNGALQHIRQCLERKSGTEVNDAQYSRSTTLLFPLALRKELNTNWTDFAKCIQIFSFNKNVWCPKDRKHMSFSSTVLTTVSNRHASFNLCHYKYLLNFQCICLCGYDKMNHQVQLELP